MRNLLLATLLLAGGSLSAASLVFQDHNFAVDMPADWKEIPPPSAAILAAAQSPNGQQRVFVFTAPIADTDQATGAQDTMSGIKQSFQGAGMHIDEERDDMVGDTPFLILDAHSGTANYITTYVTATGTEAYVIQLFSSVQGGTQESSAVSIVQRFRLLNLAPFLVDVKPKQTILKKNAYFAGAIVLVAGVIGFLLWKRRKKSGIPAKKDPQ